MAAVLGIDLGTTNSVVCVARGGELRVLVDAEGNTLIPSVINFHPSGEVRVGHAARARRLLDATNTIYSVKRLIGRPFGSAEVRRAEERFAFELCEGPNDGVLVRARDQTYTLPELSAFVLREVRRVAEEALGEPCTKAVITVPANFNELQRSATKAAGRIAGLEVLRILNEPTAAALAYGYGKGSRERVAVFDLGGGTFDITILELAGDVFEVIATAGDTFLGGDDVDVLIADRMADAFLQHHRFDPRQDAQAYERLRAAAEWAKCQLSEESEVQLRVEELAHGPGGASLDLSFGLTRTALESLIRPLVTRALEVCEDAMGVAGVRPTQLDNVVLVGGSTRIPLVRAMVADYFGREPLGHIDPDLVVARGAALQAAVLAPAAREPLATPSRPLARVALKRVSALDLTPPKREPPVPLWDDLDELPTRVTPSEPPPAERRAEGRSAASEVVASEPIAVGGPAPPPPPPTRKRADVPLGASTLGFGAGLPVPDLDAASVPPALPPSPGVVLPSVPAPSLAAGAPLLLDVTPHTLGVETVGGFCEAVIVRNAAIPVEQTRVFTTGQDDQDTVLVRVVQGESRRLTENQPLGELELTGIRRAVRGEVKIAVTFVMDADGTLGVSAKDLETGRVERVRVNLLGGLSEEEIRAMAERQARMTR